jgi:hypothetical protein
VRAGQGGDASNCRGNGSGIFLLAGLDDPNQLESPREIRVLAHAFFGPIAGSSNAMFGKFELICPSGKSVKAVHNLDRASTT